MIRINVFSILFRVSVICNLCSLTKSSSSVWLYKEIPNRNRHIVHEYLSLHPLFFFLLSPPKGSQSRPSFSSFSFSACITDAFNYTLGHSDAIYGLGLQPPRFKQHLSTEDQNAVEQGKKSESSSDESKGGLVDEENDDEEDEVYNQSNGVSAISFKELNGALSNALRISSLNVEQVCALGGEDGGWKLIHRVGDSFCLYKRRLQLSDGGEEKGELVEPSSASVASSPLSLLSSRLPLRDLLLRGRRRRRSSNRKLSSVSTADPAAANTTAATSEGSRLGPTQYLMTGNCADVSPLTFLHAQIDKQCRERWDRTMKEISLGQLQLSDYRNESAVVSTSESRAKGQSFFQQAQDVLYYRTKWPWPLKDRDYTLARRCKVFPAHNAVVFISKSVESADYPPREGVIRVDNYWCHSAIISHGNYSSPATTLVTENEASDSGDSLQYTTTAASGWGRLARIAAKTLRRSVQVDVGLGMGSRVERSASRPDRRIGVEVEFSFGKRKTDRSLRPRFVRDTDIEPESSRVDDEQVSPSPEDDTLSIPEEDREGEDTQVRSKHNGKRARVDTTVGRPGMKFVTFFCDDQKVPLHPSIVDLLSSYGEKMVPGSMERLFVVAKEIEAQRQLKLQPTSPPSTSLDTEQQQPPIA